MRKENKPTALPDQPASKLDAWLAELDRFVNVPLFEGGRRQPTTPIEEPLERSR
jgi:hypothetical protein